MKAPTINQLRSQNNFALDGNSSFVSNHSSQQTPLNPLILNQPINPASSMGTANNPFSM